MRSLQELEDSLSLFECLNDLELQKLHLELQRLREQVRLQQVAVALRPGQPLSSVDSANNIKILPAVEIF